MSEHSQQESEREDYHEWLSRKASAVLLAIAASAFILAGAFALLSQHLKNDIAVEDCRAIASASSRLKCYDVEGSTEAEQPARGAAAP
jgi:hypothetical protein